MSTPVNLNKFRKARAQEKRRAQADENAVKFGRTKAEKNAQSLRADKAQALLDGHKREP